MIGSDHYPIISVIIGINEVRKINQERAGKWIYEKAN